MVVTQPIVEQLVASTHGDIRQILNIFSTWKISRGTISLEEARNLGQVSHKDTEKGPFDITSEFMSRSSYSSHTINELLEFYFMDSSLVPLMIHVRSLFLLICSFYF